MKHTHGQRTYIALLLILTLLTLAVLILASIGAVGVQKDIRQFELYRRAAQERPSWGPAAAAYYDEDLAKARPAFRVSIVAAVWSGLYTLYTITLLVARLVLHYAPPMRYDWVLQAIWLVWGVVVGVLWVHPVLRKMGSEEWSWAVEVWIWGCLCWITVGFTLSRMLVEVIVTGRRDKRRSYWDTEREIHGGQDVGEELGGLNRRASKETV